MQNNFKVALIDELLRDDICQVNSNGTQFTIRCPYCNDSESTNHGHFSIKIDTENESPILFRCLKCDVSGIMKGTTLNDLNLYLSEEDKNEMKEYHTKIGKRQKTYNAKIESYSIPIPNESRMNNSKLNYINNRLGTMYTYNDLKKLKLILNITDFIKENKIKTIESLPKTEEKILAKLHEINNNYLGFLCANNNAMVFRKFTNFNNLERYQKIIINKSENTNTFYNLSNMIDLLYTHEINIHIAEGIFDILSIYNNLNHTGSNNLYYASTGFGYIKILKYLIKSGINTGINVHIYADNDKNDNEQKAQIDKHSNLKSWLQTLYIHRNEYPGEKDYGVSKEKIVDRFYKYI